MENRIISLVDSPEPPRNVSLRDGGLVVHVGGKNDTEEKLAKTSSKFDKNKTFKMVFCHLEFLRSTSSPALHLTQLAAYPYPSAPDHLSVFLPIVPPVLAEYLDHYKVGGDLMQTLTMTREGRDTFLFRPPILVEEVQRVVCVPESAALCTFLDFLEMIGPNIILVGLDEDSVGVLMQKLKEANRARFLKQVEGYTWWRRILKYSSYQDYKDLSLEEFYKSTFSSPHGTLLTCSLVAERLKQAVKEVACRQGFMAVSGGKFVSAVAVPVQSRPRLEEREVREGMEVLEVVNSYLSIPVTSFAVCRMEQVNIDLDEISHGHLLVDASKKKSESVGKVVKQELNEEAFSIYISSDSETEDVIQSLASGPILHGGGTETEHGTRSLAPNPATCSTAQDTASTLASGLRGTYRIPRNSSAGTNSHSPPPSSVDQSTTPPTTTQRHSLVASPRLLNTGGFTRPPLTLAGPVFNPPPIILGPSQVRPPPTIMGPYQVRPPPIMLGPSQCRPPLTMMGPSQMRPPPTILGPSQVRLPPTMLGFSSVRSPLIMLGPSQVRPPPTVLGASHLRPPNAQEGPLTDLQLRVTAEFDPALLVPAPTLFPCNLPARSWVSLVNNNSPAALSSMALQGSNCVTASSTTVPFSAATTHSTRKNLVLPPRESTPPTSGQKTAPLTSGLKSRQSLSGQSCPSTSGWRIVDTSQGGKMVICPVCQALVDLQSTKVYGETEKRSILEEHMREHKHETNVWLFWSRPCLVCVDRGDLFTRVAPEWLRTHVLSDHQVNGPFSSAPPSQPSVMSTGNVPVNVPQPLQPDRAPEVKFWEFFQQKGPRPNPHPLLVVCPCCPPRGCRLKPVNIMSHLERVHQITPPVASYLPLPPKYRQLCDRKCPGCKFAVRPEQLVKHIACQPTTMANEPTLKRKAPTVTNAKTGKKNTSDAELGKYTAVQGSSSSVKGPIIMDLTTWIHENVVRNHGSN